MRPLPSSGLLRSLFVVVSLVLCSAGCDELELVSVAPDGTILLISANPATIGLNDTAEIVVIVQHESGVPVRTGTEVRFLTDLGDLDDEVVPTDSQGIARTTLRSGDRTGTAKVKALSGVDGGKPNEVSVSIKIEKRSRPDARFSCDGEGFVVIFEDTSTGVPDTWFWDFGDGSTSTEQNPTHVYAVADTYVVALTVTNVDGTDTVREFCDADVPGGPSADFRFENDELTVLFEDRSTGDPTAWRWEFGDGSTSKEQNPRHTYAEEGTYVVTLIITNATGSDTTRDFVDVP